MVISAVLMKELKYPCFLSSSIIIAVSILSVAGQICHNINKYFYPSASFVASLIDVFGTQINECNLNKFRVRVQCIIVSLCLCHTIHVLQNYIHMSTSSLSTATTCRIRH